MAKKAKKYSILRSETQILLDSDHKNYKEYCNIQNIPPDRQVALFSNTNFWRKSYLVEWWKKLTLKPLPLQNENICYNQPKALQKTWDGKELYEEEVWKGKYPWLDKYFN